MNLVKVVMSQHFLLSAKARSLTVYADEASGWDRLDAHYEMRQINQSVSYSANGVCTNQSESYFSPLR